MMFTKVALQTSVEEHPFVLLCCSFIYYLGFKCLVLTLKCFKYIAFWMVNLLWVGPIGEGNLHLKKMWFWGYSCVCNMLNILVCIIKELGHNSSELAAACKTGSCQNKTVHWRPEARPAEFKGRHLNPSVYFAFFKSQEYN